jgi:hypothetical protein
LIEHAELIWKAKNGDRASLETLFRIHYPALGRMAYKLTWNRAQAEDAEWKRRYRKATRGRSSSTAC